MSNGDIAIVVAVWYLASCPEYAAMQYYESTTLTYLEIEHAQRKQHMAIVGVVDRRGR